MNISLWNHQKEAVNSKKDYNKCLINMWCGTGKTRVFVYSILEDKQPINIIVFPSLGLINQFNLDYIINPKFINYWKDYDKLSFCSDDERKLKNKSIKITYTTSERTLNQFLKKDKVIITVTYQSLEKFVKIIKEKKIKINRLYYDEAHHTIGNKIQEIVFNDNDFDSLVEKTEFYTATPINKNGITMYDRENPEYSDCGPIAYEYLYWQALKDKISRKYDVCLNLCSKSSETKYKYGYVFETIIRHCLSGEYNYWNILTFHSGVNELENNSNSVVKEFSNKQNIKIFKDLFKKIQKEEYPETTTKYKVKDIIFKGIYAKTKNKQNIIKDFDRKVPGRIYILSSCRTIGEGIDTKWANVEVPVDPTNSYIQESQKIGRITRRPETRMHNSSLLIPVCINPNLYISAKTDIERDELIRNELSENRDYCTFLNVISAFKYQYDSDLYELCLKYPNMYSPDEVKDNLEKQGLDVKESQGSLIDNVKYIIKDDTIELCEGDTLEEIGKKIDKTITIHTQDLDSPQEIYNKDCTESIHLFRDENNIYSPVQQKTKKGNKINPPKKRDKLFKIHTHPDLEVLWSIDKTCLNKALENGFSKGILDVSISLNVRNWYDTLENVKHYMDENGKRPNKRSKNKDIKFMGCWIVTQNGNYKKKNNIMKEENIKNEWEEFISNSKYKKYFISNEEQWYKMLDKVKKYIDKNKKKPHRNSKDKNIKFMEGWIITQNKNYKKKNHIMKDENIKNKWEEFISDSKYKQYFISNEEQWYKMLDKVKKYIDKNKKKPHRNSKDKDIKSMYIWIGTQNKNYKKKSRSMKDENFRNKWEEFINNSKYKKYFISNEEHWYKMLDKVKQYIDENNEKPNSTSKDKDIKIMGSWISNQTENYKKKNHIMKEENIKNEWEEFISDSKYKQYFISNEEQWYKMLDKVKQYIDKNKKKPHRNSKNKNIKIMGSWISNQNTKYKNKIMIMKDENIRNKWEEFINNPKYKQYFISNEEHWYKMLDKVKQYIDKNSKRPSSISKNKNIRFMCSWIYSQTENYKKKSNIMKDENIKNKWEEFINNSKYKKYFISNEEHWYKMLDKVKQYIDEKNEKPHRNSKDKDIKIMGKWIDHQKTNYKKKSYIMKDEKIRLKWKEFINDYLNKPSKKSVNIKPKKESKNKTGRKRSKNSEYQDICKKMSSQNSKTTNKMFQDNKDLWHKYHNSRDFSFKGYDKQEEIPINKIINYLESKKKRKLKILDLGCGRNKIYQHFKDNKKFNIIGYDYISYNNSIECDISNLKEEDESVNICIYSQSLMGSNWKEYLQEGKRVLNYNGEIIISESIERYENIKNYIKELGLYIKQDEYINTKRWFYIHAINDE